MGQIQQAGILPRAESAVKWNPCAVMLPEDLNLTQRLWDLVVRMVGWVVEVQVVKRGSDIFSPALDMVNVVEQPGGR